MKNLKEFNERHPVNTEINDWVYKDNYRYTLLPFLYLVQSTDDYSKVYIFESYKEMTNYMKGENEKIQK